MPRATHALLFSLAFTACEGSPPQRPPGLAFDGALAMTDVGPPQDFGPPPELPPLLDVQMEDVFDPCAVTDAGDAGDVGDVAVRVCDRPVSTDRGAPLDQPDSGVEPVDAGVDSGVPRITVTGGVRLRDEIPSSPRTRVRAGAGWTVSSLDDPTRTATADPAGDFRIEQVPLAQGGIGATLLARPPGMRELGSIVTTAGEIPALDTVTLQSAVATSMAAVDTDLAHVVVLTERQGVPLAGVAVDAPALPIRIYFDSDDFPGQLVQVTSATGRLGTAVLLNLDAPVTGVGTVRVRFSGAGPVTTVDLPIARRAITWHRLVVR